MVPHRLRLYAILTLLVLDAAALIASHYGVSDELLGTARPLLETALLTGLALLSPALADAVAVERRRKNPNVPALPDDVRSTMSLDLEALDRGLDDPRDTPRIRSTRPPPLPLLCLAVLSLTSGCDASSISIHARAATITAGALTAGGDVVTDARRLALDRVEASTVGQPVDARLEALRVERERWAPVGAALDLAREALRTWVSSLELAHLAGEGEDLLLPLVRLAARVVALYEEAAALARTLGAEMPALPAVVTSVARSIGGA